MFSGFIGVLFIGFLIFGVALGMIRGLAKSSIRFGTILLSAVVAFFVTTALTKVIAGIDISSFNVNVDGRPATTIADVIEMLLSSISVVGEVLKASPTTSRIVSALPMAIVGLVLFIVLFIVISLLFWFIYLIICKIALKKKGDGEERKKRALGGVIVSVIQSAVVFAIILSPIMGTMYFLKEQLAYVKEYNGQTEEQLQQESNAKMLAYINGLVYADETLNKVETEETKPEEVLNDLTDAWVFKAFNVLGYDKASMFIADQLTKIELDEKNKTSVFKEAEALVKIVARAEYLFANNKEISSWTSKDVAVANEMVDLFFNSPIFGNITTELVTTLATRWTSETTEPFLNLVKPKTSEDVQKVLDTLLNNLKSETKEDLKGELQAIIAVADTLIKYEVLNMVTSDVSINTLMPKIENGALIKDLVGSMIGGRAIRNTIPSVVQLGFNQIYNVLGIAEEDYKKLTITKASSEINWDTEKVTLSDMFSGMSKAYNSMENDGVMLEGDALLENLDFNALALALTSMRNSELLNTKVDALDGSGESTLAKELIIMLIDKSSVGSLNGKASVLKSIKENYATVDFYALMKTFKSAVNISSTLGDIAKGEDVELNSNDVADLLTGLQDETVSNMVKDAIADGVIKDAVGEENEDTADVVSGVLNSVIDYNASDVEDKVEFPTAEEDVNNAVTAGKEILNVLQDGTKAEAGAETRFFTEKTDMETFINKLTSSAYMFKMAQLQGASLGFQTETGTTLLTETEKTWLSEIVNAENSKITAEQANAIFGTDAVAEA